MSGKQQISGGQGNSGIGNAKFVKPSELSLDLISPNSNLRNMNIKGGPQIGQGNNSTSNSNQN
jgi:hypothetical protein